MADDIFEKLRTIKKSNVFELSIEIPKIICGIYVICDSERIVYVGQSVNVAGRLAQHKFISKLVNPRFAYIEVEQSWLSAVEQYLIHLLQPAFNTVKYSDFTLRSELETVFGLEFAQELMRRISNKEVSAAADQGVGPIKPKGPMPTRPLLVSAKEAAEMLGTTAETLADWRYRKTVNLPFVKCGRSVRYRPEDIEFFIERNMRGTCLEVNDGL